MVVVAHALVAPHRAMGGQWSLAAYYKSILMCSILCQFFLRERTRHAMFSFSCFGDIFMPWFHNP